MIDIDVRSFGKALDPLTNKLVSVTRCILTNSNQMSVTILSRGATIQSIKYPDKYGKIDEICMGFSSIQDYILNKGYYMGSTLGRVANRVARGQFEMDGKMIQLTKNFQDKYQIHGGFTGFDSVIWEVTHYLNDGIVMRHVNPDGHEGYPGKLTVTITFTLDDSNRLRMLIEATSKKSTPVNITNHAYFNLAGVASRKEGLGQHNIMIKADKIVDVDNDQLPNGSLMPVKHTPYDLRKYTNLGKRLEKFFSYPIQGFDHNYCLKGGDCNDFVAKIIHPCTGRFLELYTNQPGLQFYTANNLPDIENGANPLKGTDNVIYEKHGAFCFQTQRFPDSMNHSNFPDVYIQPKEKYCHETIYKFGVCK